MARRWWWAPLTGAAGAMALAGCASMGGSKQEPKSATMTAQQMAEQQLKQAADAQRQAAEEQQRAEEATQKVGEAQKSLAQAQARAEGQREKARAAQERAQQMTQQAQQAATQYQEQALRSQEQQNQRAQQLSQQRDTAWRQVQEVNGQVVQAQGNNIVVRDSQMQNLKLNISDATAVRVDGQMGTVDQVRPGDEVRASFQTVDGQNTATRIEVRKAQRNQLPSQTPGMPQNPNQVNPSNPSSNPNDLSQPQGNTPPTPGSGQ